MLGHYKGSPIRGALRPLQNDIKKNIVPYMRRGEGTRLPRRIKIINTKKKENGVRGRLTLPQLIRILGHY